MIILDTNVLSEIASTSPDSTVLAWVNERDPDEVGTTAITIGEMLYGIARLPAGKRKTQLSGRIRTLTDQMLSDRIRPFDEAAAVEYAVVAAARRSAGRPIGTADAQVAGICRRLGATLATRNVRDFEGTGIEIVNPWQAR